jgi:hypothetical protein
VEIQEPEMEEAPDWLEEHADDLREEDVDIMVVAGGIKPPCVTLTRIEYYGKQEETLKLWT